MDFNFEARDGGGGSPTRTTEVTLTPVNDEPTNKMGVVGAQEEYDPSQPLDSSEDDEDHGTLDFQTDDLDELETVEVPEPPVLIPPIAISPMKNLKNLTLAPSLNKEPEIQIDLNSIPMPSDEYRRPVIQFSIPTRHRLMSISSLIKRQKGVMKKQDKGGTGGLCYNSEVSKAFQTSDPSAEAQSGGADSGDEERPKISLVQEIFGSDDEDNPTEPTEDPDYVGLPAEEVMDPSSQPDPWQPSGEPTDEIQADEINLDFPIQPPTEDSNKRWKTVEETPPVFEILESIDRPLKDKESAQNCSNTNLPVEPEENSGEEIRISIKPTSELMEKPMNEEENSSGLEELECRNSSNENKEKEFFERGKENQQIILECVSEEDTDFEVTFVGIGRSVSVHRPKIGRPELKSTDKNMAARKKSMSPLNGFEEGEIIEQDRKKKKAKKKKSKKRKRSKDSRSSKLNSERSNADSVEKKSFSDNSDGKEEVSWRKPSKLTKTRNYRNGKRESEEKHITDRSLKKDESGHKKGRSPIRYAAAIEKSRSRRHRSLSSGKFRSRSGSGSRDSSSRWNGRSRGVKRPNRTGSHKSRSSVSNHSSPSHSRSRSLTKKKVKRRHSPSPIRKHRNGRSASRSPVRPSKSPRPGKRNKSNGTETSKRDKIRERSKSPVDAHPSKKSSKSKHDDPVVDEGKKKGKKEKTSSEDLDKEKKKKRKRREKSLSPVKAIVADGDSIVVSLSFQKTKEEVSRTPKVTASSKNENSSEKDKSNSNTTDHRDGERSGGNLKPSPRKGTIMINLDSSPSQEHRKSPDIIVLTDEYDQRVNKSHDSKKGLDPKSDGKSSGLGLSQRNEGLDFVSSSHDCSVDNNTQGGSFPAVPDPKVATSPAERAASSSKSPYKFSEYFVSSTCDVGKTASPSVEAVSPKKVSEQSESLLSQKVTDHSPFPTSQAPRPGNSTENGHENSNTPSPEPIHMSHGKVTSGLSSKPMIGNIPGLFPTGFSTGSGGMVTTAPIVIPAPPRIIPSTNSQPNLLNPNVLVSVASALYAPLLAAKQHHNATVSNQIGNTGMSNLSRHGQTGNIFSRNQNSHSQALGLYNNRTNSGGRTGEGDSPFSPNSSDGDDLFEPPGDGGAGSGTPTKKTDQSASGTNSSPHNTFRYGTGDGTGNDKQSMFDSLFSTAPKKSAHSKHGKKKNSSHLRRNKQKRGGKRSDGDKNGEGEISAARLSEDVPTSAVALKMKEKFLKKLNRQERVVEEVKLSLKPHYSKKHITKDEYKDILRKAVPKICHNKSGEINPNKIKELVEAYVKKFRKTRKTENKIT